MSVDRVKRLAHICTISVIGTGVVGVPVHARAQQPITREAAVAAALSRGATVAVAQATLAAAHAQVQVARAYPNPALSATYSKDAPQYHAMLDVPIDYPWLRGARIGAAAAADTSARYTFAFARAAIRFEADTTYTRALAAAAHARLSRTNAAAADSLLHMAALRRDAGDASELDVQLATVNAGQLANAAAADELAVATALLDLQRIMGLAADHVTIALADSLLLPAVAAGDAAAESRATLQVAAASAALRSAEQTLAFQRRNAWGAPSIQVGLEGHDPTSAETGLLPTLGVSLPFPLFNRNGGHIAVAVAERDRARAELVLARRQAQTVIAQALRERTVAMAKAHRDQQLLASAQRVAAMSLRAYQQGAAALASVLEAERNARAVLAQSVDDIAAANRANDAVRLFTLTTRPP